MSNTIQICEEYKKFCDVVMRKEKLLKSSDPKMRLTAAEWVLANVVPSEASTLKGNNYE